jgi:hypothetical protein
MTGIHFSEELVASVRRLLDDRRCTEEMRRMAGDVLDLTALLETWPVPRSLKLDDDLQQQVSGLCRLSGGNFCGTQHCVAHDGAGSQLACRIDWATY